MSGNVRCVELLLKAGGQADVNKQDGYRKTAVMYAVTKANWECIEAILNAGADVNKRDYEGRSALTRATAQGNFQCIEALLHAEANVDKNIIFVLITGAMDYCPDRFHFDKILKSLKLLFSAGAKVNVVVNINSPLPNFLSRDRRTRKERLQILRPLLAAGERDPSYRSELSLSHLCRDVIRKHLLELDQHENLFVRVPRLGLPAALQKFLLFNSSLEFDEND